MCASSRAARRCQALVAAHPVGSPQLWSPQSDVSKNLKSETERSGRGTQLLNTHSHSVWLQSTLHNSQCKILSPCVSCAFLWPLSFPLQFPLLSLHQHRYFNPHFAIPFLRGFNSKSSSSAPCVELGATALTSGYAALWGPPAVPTWFCSRS